LRPDLPVLEDGLKGLDQRTSFRRQKGVTDVLFVVETGNAPARQSQKFAFPIADRSRSGDRSLLSRSFSRIKKPVISTIRVGDKRCQLHWLPTST
jgi:hypothetical protein